MIHPQLSISFLLLLCKIAIKRASPPYIQRTKPIDIMDDAMYRETSQALLEQRPSKPLMNISTLFRNTFFTEPYRLQKELNL